MCPFTSNNEQVLVQHLNEVHGVLKGVACDQCDYLAGNPGRLQLHIKGVHDQNSFDESNTMESGIAPQIEKESNSEIELSEKDEWEKLLTWASGGSEST